MASISSRLSNPKPLNVEDTFCWAMVHVLSSLGLTFIGPNAVAMAPRSSGGTPVNWRIPLFKAGAFTGFPHEVIVRQGNVWDELDQVIGQERIDVVVIGAHARRGLRKMLLGSVAEHIFHHAGCLGLTVGRGSLQDSPVGNPRAPAMSCRCEKMLAPTNFDG